MELKSPGYKSDLIFTSFDGQVDDRGDYLAVRTLTNPNYFWGNLLIFDRPPEEGDYDRWVSLFKKEFPDPAIYHITLAWDSLESKIGDVEQFTSKVYDLEDNSVLTATSVCRPPKFNEALEVRTLESDADWNEMVAVQLAGAHGHLSKEEWASFYAKQATRYRSMQKSGLGHWYGGFLDGKLVVGLGLFQKDGLARYQIVSTHPDYRRQGLCGTLVYRVGEHALTNLGVNKLVMCADPNYFAIQIYESVGFKRELTQHGVCWWEKSRA